MTILYALIVHVQNETSMSHAKASEYVKSCFDRNDWQGLCHALVYDENNDESENYRSALDQVDQCLEVL